MASARLALDRGAAALVNADAMLRAHVTAPARDLFEPPESRDPEQEEGTSE